MTLPWFWITGTAVAAIGAIVTGLVYPSATPPLGSRAIIAEMEPWEVFIRTEGIVLRVILFLQVDTLWVVSLIPW